MRKLLIYFSLISLGLAGLVACAGLGLVAAAPSSAGGCAFPVAAFRRAKAGRVEPLLDSAALTYLQLAERRANDLLSAEGKETELASLNALDQALGQAEAAIAEAPGSATPDLRLRLANIINTARTALNQLTIVPERYPEQYASMQIKLQALLQVVAGSKSASSLQYSKFSFHVLFPLIAGAAPSSAEVSPIPAVAQGVVFLPGSPGAEHAFFPLVEGHANLECQDCHKGEQYAGLSSQCESCHIQDRPVNHFQGSCISCHKLSNWKDAVLDHRIAGATNCLSCHIKDKPANHFTGQCSSCHNTNAWNPATFNHQAAGATDCQSCHTKNKPANHFAGQCSSCHNTHAWKPATFNHQAAGATDCQTCHTKNKPANHFTGQCSSCHSTTAWRPAALRPCRHGRHRLPELPHQEQTRQPLRRAVLILPQHQRLEAGALRPCRQWCHRLPELPHQEQTCQPLRRAVLILPQHQRLEASALRPCR